MAPRKLLILDLNGLFVHREYRGKGGTPLGEHFVAWKRDGVDDLIEFMLMNFDVVVWSSAAKHNVDLMVDFVFGPDMKKHLKGVHDQSLCTKLPGVMFPGNPYKPVFLKELSKIWELYPEYGPDSTLLIDDSHYKNVNNPVGTWVSPKSWKPGQHRCPPLMDLKHFLDRYLLGLASARDFDIKFSGRTRTEIRKEKELAETVTQLVQNVSHISCAN